MITRGIIDNFERVRQYLGTTVPWEERNWLVQDICIECDRAHENGRQCAADIAQVLAPSRR